MKARIALYILAITLGIIQHLHLVAVKLEFIVVSTYIIPDF